MPIQLIQHIAFVGPCFGEIRPHAYGFFIAGQSLSVPAQTPQSRSVIHDKAGHARAPAAQSDRFLVGWERLLKAAELAQGFGEIGVQLYVLFVAGERLPEQHRRFGGVPPDGVYYAQQMERIGIPGLLCKNLFQYLLGAIQIAVLEMVDRLGKPAFKFSIH